MRSLERRWKFIVFLVMGFWNPYTRKQWRSSWPSGRFLKPQHECPIDYKGHRLETYYKPDFICFDEVVVELKALGRLSSVEESQVINYLKVTGFHTGLLINFGGRSLEQRRFILS
jgi:GxxExxY protein